MAATGLPAARTRVQRTGVDRDRCAQWERTSRRGALGVAGPPGGAVGALIERKGHAIVIEAMLGVPDATLLIAGDGPERGRLDALIVRLGLTDRVRLLGAVPHADLPRLIAAAAVSALASSSDALGRAHV